MKRLLALLRRLLAKPAAHDSAASEVCRHLTIVNIDMAGVDGSSYSHCWPYCRWMREYFPDCRNCERNSQNKLKHDDDRLEKIK